MTDPTPTRAISEMEAYVIQEARAGMGMDLEVADVKALAASIQALRERAEAAEQECVRLKNIRSAIAEGYNAEAVALEKAVSETLTAQLTAARRAEAAAWNDAIEAVRPVAITCFASGCDAHELDDAIRALRRAAPTEGEALARHGSHLSSEKSGCKSI